MSWLFQAISETFRNKFDRSGQPYINHIYRVSNNASNLNRAAGYPIATHLIETIALCHDVKEDFPEAWERTIKPAIPNCVSNPEYVIEGIDLVSRNREKYTYAELITKIIESKHVGAIIFKLADNMDNNNPTRIVRLKPEERTIQRSYDKANVRLREEYYKIYDENISIEEAIVPSKGSPQTKERQTIFKYDRQRFEIL